MSPVNLDFECFKLSGDVSVSIGKLSLEKDAEKLINEGLSVLSRQGPFACLLYFQSKSKQRASKTASCSEQIRDGVSKLLALINTFPANYTPEQRLTDIQKDLPSLLVARQLLLQYFTYLKYHTKSSSKSNDRKTNSNSSPRVNLMDGQ